MAITELVFPALKPTEEAKTGFFDKLPDALPATFRVPGGPVTMSLARVIESIPADAESHSGYMAVITWESLEKIEAFINTPGFADFKVKMAELSSGPTVLQFFEAAPEVVPQNTVKGASHFFVVKAVGDRAEVEAARQRWGDVTAAFAGVAGDSIEFNSGDGRKNVDGQFAGFSGWKSLEALQDALENGKVQAQLLAMRESGADVSTFTLELKHVF
ncbi:hypothetical protein CPLU01_15481 [Colletotrichum plurivorum]|uniref:ABM domain-containing protein n=1 Tax=Colletotrichum plurivorum TaxID=2175906 RepID=A0A8H6MV94_9PEZI|nr:hypothetical protein CPLU01_15481 [Colletotrichum plurivorum]